MKLKVTAIVEKTSDGMYSCSVTENLGNYGIAGYGETAEEAKEDMLECYREMKEMNDEENVVTPELEIMYSYDMQSFFNKFSFLKMSVIAEMSGINQSLLRQYATGHAVAGENQYKKLKKTINEIKEELSLVAF